MMQENDNIILRKVGVISLTTEGAPIARDKLLERYNSTRPKVHKEISAIPMGSRRTDNNSRQCVGHMLNAFFLRIFRIELTTYIYGQLIRFDFFKKL